MTGRLIPTLLAACMLVGSSQANPVVEMDDIEFWVGSGSNRSALVIDWADDSTIDPALAWGYRWDEGATGTEMLSAIVAADKRLFAKLNLPASSSSLIYGLGYDATGDGQFGLDDGTQFDTGGFAITGPADVAVSVDEDDFYAEGWFTGLWHYGEYNPDSNPGTPYNGGKWIDAPLGMASRSLVDGSWDSWTFTPTFDFQAFAENPQAAEPSFPPGDFEPDGDTDGTDLLIWQRGFGITSGATRSQGDANGDEMVNGLDLNLWLANFGSMAGRTSPSRAIPEPSAMKLTVLLLFLCFPDFRRKGKDS